MSDRPWAEYFLNAVREKMERGQREHGDGSLYMMPSDLIGETMQECEDIPGWSSITAKRCMDLFEDEVAAEYVDRLVDISARAASIWLELAEIREDLIDDERQQDPPDIRKSPGEPE